MLKLLEVMIGLCLVFFLFSVATSAVTEIIASGMKKRAELLKQSLSKMLGGESLNTKNFFDHSLIHGLSESEKRFASYIPATTFSQALTDVLIRGEDKQSKAQAWDVAVEAAFQTLVKGIHASKNQALIVLANEGEQTVAAFRKRLEAWFDSQMDRTSGWYKRYAQGVAFLVGLALAAVMNIDTLHIGSELWTNSHLREQTSGMAAMMVTDDRPEYKTLTDARDALNKSGLPIGWCAGKDSAKDSPTSCTADSPQHNFVKLIQASCWVILAKIFGIFLTALTVMLGSNFWFEMLSTLVNIRSGGAKPEQSKTTKANTKTKATGAGDGA